MPTLMAAVTSAGDSFSIILSSWKMSFSSVHFLLFLPLAVGGYFVLPKVTRRAWLLLCSYYFYFFSAPKYLVVLLFGTLVSWLGGLLVSRAKSKTGTRVRLALSAAVMVLFLCFFKYNAFFSSFLSPLFGGLGLSYDQSYFSSLHALGISYYSFTAIGYLADVARQKVAAEKNLLNYALFLGFFPVVRMGPICRAGELLPQLKDSSRRFNAEAAADGLRTMAIGYFKKMAVADTLNIFTTAIYKNSDTLATHSGAVLTLATVGFALQLYFDFSGYSDIAVGAAKLLGIQLPQNFQNPYFSTNYSTFWRRWHISLSSWLQDYIYRPVVNSRWTQRLPLLGRFAKRPPELSAILLTFLVSGIWHGNTMCFLVWGLLQAAFRIGEKLLHRVFGRPKENAPALLRAGKTLVVLVLWVESIIFFRVGMMDGGTVADAFGVLGRQFLPAATGLWQVVYDSIYQGFYAKSFMVTLFLVFSLACLALAIWADCVQHFRLKGAPLAGALAQLSGGRRWLVYFVLLGLCFAAFLVQSGGFGGASFLYEGF